MISNVQVTASLNLFAENDDLLLPPPADGTPCTALAALTVLLPAEPSLAFARLMSLQYSWSVLDRLCPSYRMWILVIDAGWRENTSFRRYTKLWRSLEREGMELPRARMDEEILETPEGIKFHAMASLDRDEVEKVGGLLRREPDSLLISAPQERHPPLHDFFAAGWASGKFRYSERLRDLAMVAARHEMVLLRPFGEFDDREGGFNLISSPEVVRRIAPDLGDRQRVPPTTE